VGYANKIAAEVNLPACESRGVPILRRCSGGGTVVQGPGCLSYTLILQITEAGPTRSISAANQFIMERNRATIEAVIGRPVSVQGHTDLAVDGLKFSGNSQRRRRHFLLFHGTFLLAFDLSLIGELLQMPSLAPQYRGNRSHAEFLTNLALPAAAVRAALQSAWGATESLRSHREAQVAPLVEQKYSTREWNWKC
jgi:lipoate-protein ligase A